MKKNRLSVASSPRRASPLAGCPLPVVKCRAFLVLAVINLSILQSSVAQDIHFSQFMAAPLHNSPAHTGLFNGDYRLMANYRSQWGSVTVPYRTLAFAGDMILSKGMMDDDFVGAGVWVYSDKAGDIALSTNQAMLSFAYHKGLSSYASHFLSVGFQAGLAQRGFDPAKVTLDNQFDGYGFSNLILPNESFANSRTLFFDMAAGISWFYAADSRSNIYAGAGAFHLNNPNQSFLQDVFPLDRRYTAFVGGKLPLGSKMSLHPSAIMHQQGPLRELVFGSYWRLGLNHIVNTRETALAFGAATRLHDAIIFSTLLEYDALNIGISYDWNVSKLALVSTGRGGPELSLSYILDTPRSGKSKKLRGRPGNCPEF